MPWARRRGRSANSTNVLRSDAMKMGSLGKSARYGLGDAAAGLEPVSISETGESGSPATHDARLVRLFAGAAAMTEPTTERVLTTPLKIFLAMVLVGVVVALWTRHPKPDLDGAIAMLADGYLDAEERYRMLLHLSDLAVDAESLRQRWAGVSAAVGLRDQARLDAAESRLPTGAARALPAEACEWLGLGDVLVANVQAAMMAEAVGDKELTVSKWAQVAAQARLRGNAFAAALARTAALRQPQAFGFGNQMVADIQAARTAAAAGDQELAAAKCGLVATQARQTGNTIAVDLAAMAIQSLK